MDISAPIIFAGILIIIAALLLLVFKFGIKEKSYEEAIAEQRQQYNPLLGAKSKPKEKKNKKTSKKLKEKPSSETDANEETIDNVPQKPHVEFKPEPEELPLKPPSPVKKEELVKPEPVKEEAKKPVKEKKSPDSEISKQKKSKPAQVQENTASLDKKEDKKVVNAPERKEEKKPIEKKEEKKVESVPVTNQTNGLPVNTAKEKKKKKSEFNTLQQLTTEKDGLLTLVRKAELSRNEIQTLIELLLNKQHEAPNIIEDWSEGKSDPTQKLKKQLAEKEQLLSDELERTTALQNKLREVRTEQQSEKSQLLQKMHALEETVTAKNIELEAEKNRIAVNQIKVDQLQAQLTEESAKWVRLIEENKAIAHQNQQLEIRVAQAQEAENYAAQMRGDLEKASMEIHRLKNEFTVADNIMKQRHQEIEQAKLINKQLEENRNGLEREVEIVLRREDDLKKELSQLKSSLQQQIEEKRKNEHSIDQVMNENRQLKTDKSEAAKLIEQLKNDLQKVEVEKQLEVTKVNGSTEQTEMFRTQLNEANNQISAIQNELQQTIVQLDESNKKNKNLEHEVEEQKARNNDISKSIRLKEQQSQKEFIQRLFPDIEGLKSASSSEDWQQEFGRLIQIHLDTLKRPIEKLFTPSEMTILKTQVEHYKSIIDDTENQLELLQNEVARTERHWKNQLDEKNAEIEFLKEQALKKLKVQLEEKEQFLLQEKIKSESLNKECQQLRGKLQSTDATATIEKLTEEVNRLSELLRLEQTKKNGDVNGSSKEQNFKATNGLSTIEHSLSSSSTSLASTEVIRRKKSKSKKRKNKGNGN